MKISILYIFLFLFMVSCSNDPVPKPKGYARIDRKSGVQEIKFDNPYFSFIHSSDAIVGYIKPIKETDVWFNIFYTDFNADIHCSYFPITKQTLAKTLEESYRLAYSHAVMADGIEQVLYSDSIHHTYGVIYNIKGNVASPLQFYMTDSVSNFLRGSLYFNEIVKQDSIAPVKEYLYRDIMQLMESLRWKTGQTSKTHKP